MPDPDKPSGTAMNEPRSARSRRRAPVIELRAEEVPAAAAQPETVQAAVLAAEAIAAASQPIAEPAAVEMIPEPEAAKPDPAMPEPKTEPELLVVPSPPPPKSSMAVPLAIAALVGAVFGGISGALAPKFLGTGTGGDATRLTALERSQQDLSKQLPGFGSAADLDKLRQTITKLEADVAKRVSDAAVPLNQKITGLEGDVKAIAARPVAQGSAPSVQPVDLSPIQQRIATLEAQLKALDAKTDAASKAADPKIAALDQKVDQASRRIEAGSAAPLFAATQALAQAFHRGGPYINEITVTEVLGAKPEQLLPLKAFAEKGAPTPQALASSFAPLAAKLAGTSDQSGISGFIQRFVTVRPTAETAGDTPPALVGTIEAALRRGDVSAAVAAWARLPESGRTLSATWAAQAGDRDKAAKALATLQDAAVAALRK